MFDDLQADFARYRAVHGRGARAAVVAAFQYGFIAICVYRYGRWARALRPRLLSYPFKFVYLLLRFAVDVLFGINVSVNCEIGPGFYIGHFGCIIVYGKIGRHCSIGQGVTLGSKGAGKSDGWPELGDHVYIGAGAKVIGHIRVGSHVVIGANTVVVKDVPDYTRVVGAAVRMMPLGDAKDDDAAV